MSEPSTASPAVAAAPGAPAVRLRLRITRDGHVAVGPGKIDLLEAVQRTGSITAAAKRLGMSYRRAWLLLDELNAGLREPAVESAQGGSHGGGSRLTAAGHELVRLYREVEHTALRACADDIERLKNLLVR